ncbi:MAG: hypothetical protein V4460_10235 [Pseudomonadota bacterium]
MLLPLIALISAVPGQDAGRPPSAVPGSTAPSPTAPSNEQRIAHASNTGRLIYGFDRAAWVSTDALMAAVPKDQLTGVGGYVVEVSDEQTLHVTYYRESNATAQAFFVADVRGGKVVRQEQLPQPVALTPSQAFLAHAREIAVERAKAQKYEPCTPAPFNTVVLPSPNGGPVAVYLLTAQQDAATYVMGGNYRVVVAPDGHVLSSRPFNVSCLAMKPPKLPPGATAEGFMTTHLLDPVPTEIHVFTSYNLHMPLFVGTAPKTVWVVKGSSITLAPIK